MSTVTLDNKTILVTGAAGFIGSNLVKRIYQEAPSATVIGIDNMNAYYDVALKEFRLNELAKYPTFTFVKGNIADKALITELFEKYKPAVVVNLAAQAGVRYSITNPDAYVESNLVGFFNILEACRHCESLEHLVYASSSSVYGSNKKVPYSTDDKVDNPVSLYAATKKSNELMGFPNYIANANEINTGAYSTIIEQVGNGSPLMSGASYGGFVILWFASFMAEIGSKNKLNEVNIGMSLSAIFIFGAATICCFALIGYIDIVGAADIPALVLAAQISPILAQAFAVIICAGIYTSAVPLLWTGVRKISNEGTKKYKIVTVVAGVVGCLIACFVPYKGLINILYGMNGYLGFILVFFMIIYDVKTKMSKNVKAD